MQLTLTCDETWSRRRDHDREPDLDSRALSIIKNSAPDTKGVNNAAVMEAQTARDALAWAQRTYEEQAPDRQAASDLDRRVAESQIAGMDFATMQARNDAERRRTVFEPIEDRLAADAQAYDTPERRAEAASRAAADVETAAGQAVTDMNRDILRRGGSLDDGGARSSMVDLALGKARARAGASDNAVRNVEAQGHARMMDAAGIGRGVVSSQATQQQIASNAGAGAVNAAGAALGATMAGNSTMQTGFGQAMQGYQATGNLYGQAAQIKNTSRGQDLNFLGSVFDSYMRVPSDRKIKTGTGKPVDVDQALAEVTALRVEDGWSYDPAKGGPDDGGARRTGPMAQEVRAKMGDRVAPGGKAIDLVSMNGKLIASMQALAKRIGRLEHAAA